MFSTQSDNCIPIVHICAIISLFAAELEEPNIGIWGIGLEFTKRLATKQGCAYYPFPKWQILDSSKRKEFADDNLKFNENGRKKWAISPFPAVFSKDLYCRHVKTRACLGKG